MIKTEEFTILRLLTNGNEVEVKVKGTNPKDALTEYWRSLTSDEMDNTESLEILEDMIT